MSSAPLPASLFLVESSDGETSVSDNLVFSHAQTERIVRLSHGEYPDYLEEGDVFTHFNLGTRVQVPDISYVLGRVLRHGKYADRYAEQNEAPPLLGFRDVHVVRCEESGVLTHDQLGEGYLAHSFPHLRTTADVKNIIVQRYQASMPDQSREQLLSQGLVYAHFRVLRRVSFILQNGVFVSLD